MKAKKTMEMKEVLEDIRTKPTVPLWPHFGMALGVSRNTLYEAAVSGDIDTIKVGRSIRAVSATLRKRLGLDKDAA
jgi:hypothetical protein